MASGRVTDKMKSGGDPRERFELLTKIGKGAYGYVCKAQDRLTGSLVAVKIINLEDAGDEVDDVHQEIAVMSNMNCPQLTKYFSSYVLGVNLWIVMEYLEAGSLLDIIKEKGPLQEPFVAYIMKELLSALAYLHSERKIHRDVKAGNILVAGDGSVKLADFGVTGQLTDSIDKRQTKVGTPFWMAPEVISQSAYDGCADVWSTGITAIELCKGAPPYANRVHPFQAILLIPKNPAPVLDGAFSEEFKDFVACCLVKSPAERPSAATLLRHPFITAVTGIPPAWTAFVQATVEERRAKAVSMSADEGLDQAQAGDDADWNFTMRTGLSLNSRNNSGSNSRAHSRSNSQLGSFSQGIEASSSSSTQGGQTGTPHQRSLSRSNSKSQSRSVPGDAAPVRQAIRGDLVLNSRSFDSDGSADDILSDDDPPTPRSARDGAGRGNSPAPTTSSVTAASAVDYEGISFPTSYPSKVRSPIMPLSKNSLSPTTSPRNGPPPRPKSLPLSDSAAAAEMTRAAAMLEERISNLQQEVHALSKENSLLRAVTAPYLRALDLLSQHQHHAAHLLPDSKLAVGGDAGAPTAPALSLPAAIQQAVYAEDTQKVDDVINHVHSLTAQSVVSGSAAYKNVLMPAVNQLLCRVAASAAEKHSSGSGRPGSVRKPAASKPATEEAGDVLKVLLVALAGLDACDSANAIQKALLKKQVQAGTHAGGAHAADEVSLTAPTPKAAHGSRSTVAGAASAGRGPVDASLAALEHSVAPLVPGLGSLDLLTLLTAYLEDDLRQPVPEGAAGAARK